MKTAVPTRLVSSLTDSAFGVCVVGYDSEEEVVLQAAAAMDAVRAGEYDTGLSPCDGMTALGGAGDRSQLPSWREIGPNPTRRPNPVHPAARRGRLPPESG